MAAEPIANPARSPAPPSVAAAAKAIWDEVRPTANQLPEEFMALIAEVLQLRPKHIMEIGTDRGGTFRAFGTAAIPAGLKISLDMPNPPLRPKFDFARLHREMPGWFPGVHMIHADSHAPATLQRVQDILGTEKLDFLFIDGDHSYAGVKQDFEMYGPLVRPGGMVAFHDIADTASHRAQGCFVARFWKELVGEKREFVQGGSWGGIGVWKAPLKAA